MEAEIRDENRMRKTDWIPVMGALRYHYRTKDLDDSPAESRVDQRNRNRLVIYTLSFVPIGVFIGMTLEALLK